MTLDKEKPDRAENNSDISSANSLNIEQVDKLFIQADRAFRKGEYADAIKTFEELYRETDAEYKQYFQIQRGLVKAYRQNNQLDAAIDLCKHMAVSDREEIRIWGEKFLAQLAPDTAQAIADTLPYISQSNSSSKPQIEYLPFHPKTLAEFKNYCQENLLPDLKEFERKRKQTLWTILITGILILVIPYLIIQGLSSQLHLSSDIFFIFYLLIFSSSFFIWLIFCQGCIQAYGLGFKQKIIEKIVTFIDEYQHLTYANQLLLEDKRYTTMAFTHSQLFQDNRQEPDFLEQEDCVYGKIGQTSLFFAEINVHNESGYDIPTIASLQKRLKEADWQNPSLTIPIKILYACLKFILIILILLIRLCSYTTNSNPDEYNFFSDKKPRKLLFRGLFFTAKFPKNFQGKTFVIPHEFKSRIKTLNLWRGELVKLEDPEFNRVFTVYSNNQVQARYILSTNLMNKLVKFSQKANKKIHMSFLEGQIYIAIRYNYNLFEPKLWQNMLSFAPLREYFHSLQLMIGVVEELNLNRQIWNE